MIFNGIEVNDIYPGAVMLEAMRIWSLPKNKEQDLQKHCNSGEYFGQIKKDGYFYQFNRAKDACYLFSRNISVATGLLSEKIENVPHIEAELSCLPPNTVLIGEIYVPGGTSKDTTRIMGCLPDTAVSRQKTDGYVKYYVHDIAMLDGVSLMKTKAEKRYEVLEKLFNKFSLINSEHIELAKMYKDNLFQLIGDSLDNGEEGVVLKKKDAPYTPGKKPAWSAIKCKKVDYADVVCMGFDEPTMIYEGKEIEDWTYWTDKETHQQRYSGSFYGSEDKVPVTKAFFNNWVAAVQIGAYDDNGNLKQIGTVSSGLTDELKEKCSNSSGDYIGKVVEIQCMEKSIEEYSFRHPILKRFRDDKNPKECTIKELF